MPVTNKMSICPKCREGKADIKPDIKNPATDDKQADLPESVWLVELKTGAHLYAEQEPKTGWEFYNAKSITEYIRSDIADARSREIANNAAKVIFDLGTLYEKQIERTNKETLAFIRAHAPQMDGPSTFRASAKLIQWIADKLEKTLLKSP